METIIAGVLGIGATWFFSWLYYRKSKNNSGVALGNVMESVRRDKRLAKGLPLAGERKKIKGILATTKNVLDVSIPQTTLEQIKNIVEKVTSQVVKSWRSNEIYFPELLLYQRILKEAAQKIELPILRYLAVQDYGTSRRDVENGISYIHTKAAEARERLKELGEEVLPNLYKDGGDAESDKRLLER